MCEGEIMGGFFHQLSQSLKFFSGKAALQELHHLPDQAPGGVHPTRWLGTACCISLLPIEPMEFLAQALFLSSQFVLLSI
jgi:hypothetical protein